MLPTEANMKRPVLGQFYRSAATRLGGALFLFLFLFLGGGRGSRGKMYAVRDRYKKAGFKPALSITCI